LRRLALETIDLAKDPYYMRNHLGQIECRLCLTLHNNEGNYLAHTQVRRLNRCSLQRMGLLTILQRVPGQAAPAEPRQARSSRSSGETHSPIWQSTCRDQVHTRGLALGPSCCTCPAQHLSAATDISMDLACSEDRAARIQSDEADGPPVRRQGAPLPGAAPC
jgi:hypothetical protein